MNFNLKCAICFPESQVPVDEVRIGFQKRNAVHILYVEHSRKECLIPLGSVIVAINGVSFNSIARNEVVNKLVSQADGVRLAIVQGRTLDVSGDDWINVWVSMRKKLLLRKEFKGTRVVQVWPDYHRDNHIFAQANAFFVLELPGDSTVHGLPMASVTCRKHFKVNVIRDSDWRQYTHHRNEVHVFEPTPNDPNYMTHVPVDGSYSPAWYFIPLTRAVASPILVLPWYVESFNMRMKGDLKWSKNDEPTPFKLKKERVNSKKKRRYAGCSKEGITHVSLIDMYPSRRKLRYDERLL